MKDRLQLSRTYFIAPTFEDAEAYLKSHAGDLRDGEVLLTRYNDAETSEIKSMMGICYHDIATDTRYLTIIGGIEHIEHYIADNQADWEETDTTSPRYIKNKPNLPDTFIDINVDNLVNYYTKSEVYTKEEINDLLGDLSNFTYEVYSSLEDITEPSGSVLYLIGPDEETGVYNEYVYYQESFLHIGDTRIDLSNYYTKEEINSIVNNISWDDIQNKPTIPTVGEGEISFKKGNGTIIKTINLNQSTDDEIDITPSVDNNTVIIDDNGNIALPKHHKIESRELITTDEYSNAIYKNNVRCELNNRLVDVVNLYEFKYNTSGEPFWNDSEHKIVFSKNSVTQDNVYAGIFYIKSWKSQGCWQVIIKETANNHTQTHNIACFEDTPSSGTFVLITTLEWDIQCTYNGQSMWAYLVVPKDFVGTIEMCNFNWSHLTDGKPASFDSSNNVPWKTLSQDVYIDCVTTMQGTPIEQSSDFGDVYGKYYTSILSDFKRVLQNGEYLEDDIINDALLHTLELRIQSLQETSGGSGCHCGWDDYEEDEPANAANNGVLHLL